MEEVKKDKQYYEEKARELFREGYNCAQAVLLTFADECGVDKATAARMAQPLGGGISRLREVCGAATGLALAVGLLWGTDDPKDMDTKKAVYQRTQALLKQFREDNGSIVCKELLGAQGNSTEPVPSPRTEQYYSKRPCVELVAYAAGLVAEMKAEG